MFYDSTTVVEYEWADSTKSWERNNALEHKIINTYRKTIRVLEYEGAATGLVEQNYNVVTPDDYVLEHNYPNPFNPTTTIKFSLPLQKEISLKIYDMLGKEVATLINHQTYKKGNHTVKWDGTNNYGTKVASGNYIARFNLSEVFKNL